MTTTYPRDNYYDFYIRMPTANIKGYTVTGATYYLPLSYGTTVFPTDILADFGTLDLNDRNLTSQGRLTVGNYSATITKNSSTIAHNWTSYAGSVLAQKLIALKEQNGYIALKTSNNGLSSVTATVYTNPNDGYPYLDVQGYNTYIQNALSANGSTLTASWTNGGGLVSGDKHRVYYASGLGLTADQVIAANTFVETTSFDASSKDITGLANGDYSVVVVDCQNVSGTFYGGARSSVQSLTVGGTGGTGSPISLAGSASIQLSANGNEQVLRSLTGSASMQVQATGALDISSYREVSLAGSAGIQVTTGGDDRILRSLTGSTAVQLTTSGDDKVLRSLIGSTSIKVATSGDDSVTQSLEGSMSLQVQATGTINIAAHRNVSLTGDTSIQLTTSGDDRVLRSLTGSTAVQLTTSGDDRILRSLEGSTDIQLTASGDDRILRSLEGNTDIQLATSGDDKVLRSLIGNTNVQLTTSGDDKVLRSLAGSTSLTITANPSDLIREMLFTGSLSINVSTFGSIQKDTANVVQVIELSGIWRQEIQQKGAKQVVISQEGVWEQVRNHKGEKQRTVSQEGLWRQEIKQKGMI